MLDAYRRFAQCVFPRKTPTRNANQCRQTRYRPIKRGAATLAKVPRLVVVLGLVMEREHPHFAFLFDYALFRKIRGNTERAAGASLAIAAMAHAVNFGLAAHGDFSGLAGAAGGALGFIFIFHRKSIKPTA